MAISRISSATNNGTTVTLGTHAKGDLILYLAYNQGSGVIPTLPAGVLGLYNRSSSAGSQRIGYYIADSSSETVGTTGWTNADNVTALVYRGGSSSIVALSFLSLGSATSTTITYAAQGAGTLKENATDLWLAGYGISNSVLNNLSSLAPSGMSSINNSVGANFEVGTYDTNATRTTAWPATNVTAANSAVYFTIVIELLELDHRVTGGGGGLILPRSMDGGYSG
jgi:hypothetical protein